MSNQIGPSLFFLASTIFFPSMELTTLSIFQADAIISRLNIADYQKEGDQPTLLITSDIVRLDYLCTPNFGWNVCHGCGGKYLLFYFLLECYHLYDYILNCS